MITTINSGLNHAKNMSLIINEVGARMTVSLRVPMESNVDFINQYSRIDYFIRKNRKYITMSRNILSCNVNATNLVNIYNDLLSELMIISRQMKISDLKKEIDKLTKKQSHEL